jgi:hypothetical protein
VTAAWRARRADRIEAASLDRYLARGRGANDGGDPAGGARLRPHARRPWPRAFDILAHYRGSVLAELFRSLAALEARQARNQSAGAPGVPELSGAKTK